MACIICNRPKKIHGRGRCHCCYNYLIANGVDRSPQLIQRLNNYSRPTPPQKKVKGFLCACRKEPVSHRVQLTVLSADDSPIPITLYLCDTCHQLLKETT